MRWKRYGGAHKGNYSSYIVVRKHDRLARVDVLVERRVSVKREGHQIYALWIGVSNKPARNRASRPHTICNAGHLPPIRRSGTICSSRYYSSVCNPSCLLLAMKRVLNTAKHPSLYQRCSLAKEKVRVLGLVTLACDTFEWCCGVPDRDGSQDRHASRQDMCATPVDQDSGIEHNVVCRATSLGIKHSSGSFYIKYFHTTEQPPRYNSYTKQQVDHASFQDSSCTL